MEREGYILKLEAWAASLRRKPLILEGARQVGKTWLMRKFAETHYEHVVYARFDQNKLLRGIFKKDFDVNRIVNDLEILFNTRINAGNTILLFDEIQACKDALTSLKYFCEDRPDLPVIAAGSLLGLTYRDDEQDDDADSDDESTGFPVGKVDTIKVYPLSFLEFLGAIGETRLSESIRVGNWATLDTFNDRINDRLRHYYVVGGMPAAVAAYVESRNFLDVRTIHRGILEGYRLDISKHAPKGDVRKIEMCWQSIPAQLAKENKKFVYSALKKGGRAAEFRDPLAWLEDAGLISIVKRVTTPKLPLEGYVDGAFKVYMLDVGLLATLSDLPTEVVLEGSRIFTEFKGALTEQYVFNQLRADTVITPYYWSTEDSRCEVDFVFQRGMTVCPLEVKAEKNVYSQRLKSYRERFRPSVAYRVSMLPYCEQKGVNGEMLYCIPLAAVGCLKV